MAEWATFGAALRRTPYTVSIQLEALLRRLPFEPTADQRRALEGVVRLLATDLDRPALVLRGAAGTGKTAITRAIVPWLEAEGWFVVLMAPTGRAAKVLSAQAGRQAATVHKTIYSAESTAEGALRFRRRRNDDPERTVYLVDEASMLGEGGDGLAGTRLLEDLLSYCLPHSFEGRGRRLILIGDPAQLPPVGLTQSPGLEADYLRRTYGLTAGSVHLREVRRQALDSPILRLATALRSALEADTPHDQLVLPADCLGGEAVRCLDEPEAALDAFADRYDADRAESATLLTYSNGVAVQANGAVRQRRLGESRILEPGDQVLVVKNHYNAHLDALPFIANGELGRVRKLFSIDDAPRYGLTWAAVECSFVDPTATDPAAAEVTVGGLVPVELLQSKAPALSHEQVKRLWAERRADLANLPEGERPKRRRGSPPPPDPYLHPLQLKHGYALTAHKAQGGQWDDVVVLFEPALERLRGEDPRGWLRWCYTAVTRASQRLTLYRPPFRFR